MTYELPKRRHLVHKPVEPRNLSKKLQGRDITDAEQFIWQLKYDGCNMMVVVKRGEAVAYSRTGELVRSVDHILRDIEKLDRPQDCVYFGEAWAQGYTHSEISGMFRQFDPAPSLHFIMFDTVSLEGFEAGEEKITYLDRLAMLRATHLSVGTGATSLSVAHTFSPERLEYTEKLIEQAQAIDHFVLDGFIAKKRDGFWKAGAGKGGEQIKVKDHLSLDLRCVGIQEGQGKFAGMVGSVVVSYNGVHIPVGGGKLTDEERRYYFNEPSEIIGKIVEVHALAASQHGVLREPRFQRVRTDKSEPDA